MDDFPASMTGHGHGHRIATVERESMDSDRIDIYAANDNPNQIVTHAPKERFRLGYFDVLCLVVNFMIGTGVFNSHGRVMKGTDSTGAAILLWFAGIVYCLCGTHVYIEYGLNVPRYNINGVEQSVPRSGGDLNYLQYAFGKPAYRKNTITMSACVFGIGFIAFGNMAGNAINFAVSILRASGIEHPNNGTVRGIAIAVATLTCFIHAFSRRGGIFLNNMFAMAKAAMLLLIVITAIVVGANGLPKTENVIQDNTDPTQSFETTKTDANGYAHAFLAVIFSFWGFEQPNYIMGEISQPKRKFPIAMSAGVAIVCTLYMAVTISYMVVVPKELQVDNISVAQHFFELSLGKLGGPDTGKRVFNAFIAISSVGNMIVMTYTAARVKQEIAKEGILPYAKFFAQNTDLSLGRLLNWLKKKGMFARLLSSSRWLLPEHHSEKTPVGAFVLHFLSCLILIFATWGLTPDEAYDLLTTICVYVINCFFGIFIGLGILVLRFKGPPRSAAVDERDPEAPAASWTQLTGRRINPVLSVFCASFFTICNAWPVITTWVKPTATLAQPLAWWLVPTIAWAVIALGVAWFLGFLTVAHNIGRKHHKVFIVEKKPEFESADGDWHDKEGQPEGGLVLVHETTYLSWVGKETLHAHQPEFAMGDQDVLNAQSTSAYAGTDFDGYFKGMQQQQRQVGPDMPAQRQNHHSHFQRHFLTMQQPPNGQESPIMQQNSQFSQHLQQPPRSYSGNYRF